jgi:hypothetical protein
MNTVIKQWVRAALFSLLVSGVVFAADSDPSVSYGLGVGIENKGTTAARLNTFSLMVDLTDKFQAGANLGFLNTTDQVLLGPKLKYTCLKTKVVHFFSQTGWYYRRGLAAGDGITLDAVGGAEFRIPEVDSLGIAMAYGLVADFIDQNDIGVVNTHPFGNFAVHVYF